MSAYKYRHKSPMRMEVPFIKPKQEAHVHSIKRHLSQPIILPPLVITAPVRNALMNTVFLCRLYNFGRIKTLFRQDMNFIFT